MEHVEPSFPSRFINMQMQQQQSGYNSPALGFKRPSVYNSGAMMPMDRRSTRGSVQFSNSPNLQYRDSPNLGYRQPRRSMRPEITQVELT